MLSGKRFPLRVESTIMHPPLNEKSEVEIKARGAERPVVGVAVGGLKVASSLKPRRVPESTTEISHEG